MRKRALKWLAVAALAAGIAAGASAGEGASTAGGSKLLVRDGDVVVTCGDSITCGSYPGWISEYMFICAGLKKARVLNAAMYGKDTPYLLEHMEKDVLPYKPTVVTICMGMNSAGKTAKLRPSRPGADKSKARLVAATEAVIRRFKAAGVRTIVLGSSSPTDTDTMRNRKPTNEDSPKAIASNESLKVLSKAYEDVAKRTPDVVWADVFDDFMKAMAAAKKKYGRQYHVAGGDGVHPKGNGHLAITYSFLRAMGFDGHIGTVTFDIAKGRASATQGHKILAADGRAVKVESTRYPYCFYPSKNGSYNTPDNPASLLPCLPFNRDLNRFMLVVKGAKPGKYKVSWEKESQTFTAKQLEQGINLADVFWKKTPFHKSFSDVSGRIRERATAIWKMKKAAAGWDKVSPKTAGYIAVEKRLARAEKAILKGVEPVKHHIYLEHLGP